MMESKSIEVAAESSIECSLMEEEKTGEDRTYISYGIITKSGGSVRQIADLSLERGKIERLVELINTHALSELHIDDIVEDFLAEEFS